MALSGALGIIAGFVGFVPILFVKHQVRRGNPLLRRHTYASGILSVGASFLLLLALLLLAWRVAEDQFLVFALVLVLTFLTANTWYAVRENRR